MGDWIRSNQFTASVIVTLLLLVIFSFTIAKPYVDRRDVDTKDDLDNKLDTVYNTIKMNYDVNVESLEYLKKLADGR